MAPQQSSRARPGDLAQAPELGNVGRRRRARGAKLRTTRIASFNVDLWPATAANVLNRPPRPLRAPRPSVSIADEVARKMEPRFAEVTGKLQSSMNTKIASAVGEVKVRPTAVGPQCCRAA